MADHLWKYVSHKQCRCRLHRQQVPNMRARVLPITIPGCSRTKPSPIHSVVPVVSLRHGNGLDQAGPRLNSSPQTPQGKETRDKGLRVETNSLLSQNIPRSPIGVHTTDVKSNQRNLETAVDGRDSDNPLAKVLGQRSVVDNRSSENILISLNPERNSLFVQQKRSCSNRAENIGKTSPLRRTPPESEVSALTQSEAYEICTPERNNGQDDVVLAGTISETKAPCIEILPLFREKPDVAQVPGRPSVPPTHLGLLPKPFVLPGVGVLTRMVEMGLLMSQALADEARRLSTRRRRRAALRSGLPTQSLQCPLYRGPQDSLRRSSHEESRLICSEFKSITG